MKKTASAKIIFVFFLALIAQGCSTFQISSIDFGWPVEEVLNIDAGGTIQSNRYSFSFSVSQLFLEEKLSADYGKVDKMRVLRNLEGYYFITAQSFKNVYVFYINEGKLILANKITVNEKGLTTPAMNQRSPYIELVDGSNPPLLLTAKGIKGDSK